MRDELEGAGIGATAARRRDARGSGAGLQPVSRWAVLWLATGIVLVAANLRPAVVAVSPILEQIRSVEGLSATAAGVLTALPVLCFGALAPAAPRLALRFGMERTLLLALLVLVAGVGVRWLPGLVSLYVGTVLVGGAIAVGNVLLPALIKRDFADRPGLMTGLYTMAICGGGALGAGLTVPVARAAGLDWRAALGFWGLFAVLAVAVWIPQAAGAQHRPPSTTRRPSGLLRDRVAWQVTAFMGLQSLSFYATAAWLPAVFVARGTDPAVAGWLLALAGGSSILTALLTPVLVARLQRQVGATLLITGTLAAGLLGIWLLPGTEWLWMVVLGLGQGAALGVALTLIVLRAPDGARAAQLSGLAQSIGYCLAAFGPFLLGALHDLTGGWTVPLLALLLLLIPQAMAGAGAGRDRYVGTT